jgi:BirA family transcriptional regulator, biotin operon repressor / biotin---[acetyl-CoA-carboxylase] ligase
VTDSLDPGTVLPLLRGRFGKPYTYAERCESTQRLLGDDAPVGAVAASDEQTAGRGRLGRVWVAPAGSSVLASVVLHPDVPTENLAELSLVAGRACAQALAEMAGVVPAVKWPNDVLIDGRKVAGILAEARDGRVLLGIGINVHQTAEQLPERVEHPATSLLLEAGRHVQRAKLLASLLDHLEREHDAWVSGYR